MFQSTLPKRATNLATLALADGSASSGKWTSETVQIDQERTRREIRHYGTLMMVVALDNDRPFMVIGMRPGGSMSDKCGLSRIRQSLIAIGCDIEGCNNAL